MKVKKAVIPVAGLGTRLLPATKNVPKEMLPIVDKPSILYVVKEAVDAGIETIVLVQGRNKYSIEDFFDITFELEHTLKNTGKNDLLGWIQQIHNMANIVSVRQKKSLGLGNAVYCAKPVIGDESFAVLLPDEVMVGNPNTTKTLISTFEEFNKSTISILNIPTSDVNKYGIAFVEPMKEDIYKVNSVIEKPKTCESNWALPGRYVFDHNIFETLKNLPKGEGGEIQLSEAIGLLAKKGQILARECKNTRFDTGNKSGYIKANIYFALKHPEISSDIKKYLQDLREEL